jgi:hypothetical protein
MFTEHSLRDHPFLVKAFMGIAADRFWELIEQMTERFASFLQHQRDRPDRQRAIGAGRTNDKSLAIRTALVLTYLRLHIPQATVGALFGATQTDVSRELRRLLPLIQQCLPAPLVWEIVVDQQSVPADTYLALDQHPDGRVLIDATEQRVSRPQDSEQQKAYYSGKKKAFTLKTQVITDGQHHIEAISVAVPGAEHVRPSVIGCATIARLPDGCEADADKGYQGLANQVEQVRLVDPATGTVHVIPRLLVQTPFKKPKGQELTDEQKAFNRALGGIRIRVEHCLGWAKNWAILATRFRCDHAIYTSIMRTICAFVNVQTQRWQAAKANCA